MKFPTPGGIGEISGDYKRAGYVIRHPFPEKWRFNDEKNLAIREEVQLLLKAQVIRELKFSGWIRNVVLLKKPNNKWHMCIDFTSLNKAYPKERRA
ncbi:hypothetical protein LIER_21190 [Lithospermum erythrorhizon]|uniref:Uncharacterized protein n=1 Tax=Lithospermum erythrorhizon TaxID=34254 RepID=A0AAV3QPG2_LITER